MLENYPHEWRDWVIWSDDNFHNTPRSNNPYETADMVIRRLGVIELTSEDIIALGELPPDSQQKILEGTRIIETRNTVISFFERLLSTWQMSLLWYSNWVGNFNTVLTDCIHKEIPIPEDWANEMFPDKEFPQWLKILTKQEGEKLELKIHLSITEMKRRILDQVDTLPRMNDRSIGK